MKRLLIIASIATLFVVASAAAALAVTPYGPVLYNVLTGDEFGSSTDNVPWPNTAGTGDDSPGVWPNNANPSGLVGGAQWSYYSAATDRGYDFVGFTTSTHPQGTWNSPYTAGIDGFNYNDPQDYITGARSTQSAATASLAANSGPHGGYLTSTHKCRECHAVHRAAGKFKLTRADTREDACDWCHGKGAGSGFNVQMDNNDEMTREYDVGHSLGFNLNSGKWKAPDDTAPAFDLHSSTGGFSCFDCHSPHANQSRILGGGTAASQAALIVANGATITTTWGAHPLGLDSGGTLTAPYTGQIVIANPGHDIRAAASIPTTEGPLYPGGSWILLENPDDDEAGYADSVAGTSPSSGPINKFLINWDNPLGPNRNTNGAARAFKDIDTDPTAGINVKFFSLTGISDFCVDCHDGNAGLSNVQASMFSEDRALRNQASSYDIGYSHDANPSH